MRNRVLTGAAVLILALTVDAGAQAPAAGARIAGGEEVMFVNGARLRCEAACRVVMLPEGAMQIAFEHTSQAQSLSLHALIGPLRFTLVFADHGRTYELGEGALARFDDGVQRDGAPAVLLETLTLAQIEAQSPGLGALEASGIVDGHSIRALRGRRERQIGSR